MEKLNHWISLTANLAVLAGIVVLVYEIRQNTIATEAQVTWEHNTATRELYYPIIVDPILSPITLELRAMSESQIEELVESNDSRWIRYELFFQLTMNFWEARYYTQTSDVERQRLEAIILRNSTIGESSRYAVKNASLERFRPEFAEFIDIIQRTL